MKRWSCGPSSNSSSMLTRHHAYQWHPPTLRFSASVQQKLERGYLVMAAMSQTQPVAHTERRPPIMMFATLPNDVITLANKLAYPKALKVALLAQKSIGMDAVVVEVWWGLVEGRGPHCYTWDAYEEVFDMLNTVGLKVRVHLCFHGNGGMSLPAWVLEIGTLNPDIFFSDRQHDHSLDCLSIGIDDVPVLRGRTALQCYFDLMHSFHHRFKHLYCDTDGLIQEVAIGMGPHGELRYPSFRSEKWEFPGIGEFQCYDEYMLSMLHAAALETGHAEYGHGGPHDAGSYCQWPQQTKFFRDSGSWSLEYGDFFLEWYSNQLLHHADALLCVAQKVFRDSPVQLQVKLPAIHWWHHTQSHAAELTAGINHTSMREGYLPIMHALARWECDVLISACEKLTSQQPGKASCDPEALISHVHTCASVVDRQIGLETSEARFDETAFSRIEQHLGGTDRKRAMQLNPIKSFTFNRMGSLMFEPSNWHRYKAFINRLTQRLNKEGS